MIPQKDLEKTTGYIHGANNPVGIRQKHNYPIFIDETALDLEKIDCLCWTRSDTVSSSHLKIWQTM